MDIVPELGMILWVEGTGRAATAPTFRAGPSPTVPSAQPPESGWEQSMAPGVDMACWEQDTALPSSVPTLQRAWSPTAPREQEARPALSDLRKVVEALERACWVEGTALEGQDLAQLGVDTDHQEEGRRVP